MSSAPDLGRLRIDSSLKQSPRGRRLVKVLIYAALGLLVVAAFNAYPYLVPQTVEAQAVRVISADTTTSTVVLSVTGYVIPHYRVELAPRVFGRVERITVDKGDRVEKGQLLVQIEDREYRAELDRARAAVARAEANLAEIEAGSRRQEIEQFRAEMELAEARVRDTSQTLERIRPLVEAGVQDQQALDRARNELDVEKARLASARKRYELAVEGAREEAILAARAAVEEARAAVRLAEIQVENCTIRAPIDGTILERLIEVGELVTNVSYGGTRGARAAMMSIADLSDMRVEIDVNQSDLSRVRPGQPCEVTLEAFPERRYRAAVAQIAPEASRQKATVQVKVQILEPDEFVRPEFNARVAFLEPLESADGAPARTRLFVPPSSIVDRQGYPNVAVIESGRAHLKRIRRGIETPDGVEIVEGLTGSERIVVRPPDGLRDGASIRERTG